MAKNVIWNIGLSSKKGQAIGFAKVKKIFHFLIAQLIGNGHGPMMRTIIRGLRPIKV